ncbi:hypothetical protein [Cellvibrio fibrivorans]|uniref:ATPase/uncharacterized coiled-coil DUF342 family protein n=1 Tax=Cellvibrio fibrivorans TaxID=126350 RepID=A0ABU1UTS5_9GAMM|nr:hypothetical protein [Cellvibrio fibrivorans]MDR7088593.1 putative ATPase/uncharacterized coiled-coil DUF342 family protein [Cellvibrio fibrivorans]
MLGMIINSVSVSVSTNGGEFFTHIPFEKGLNIVRAENSSGKSTSINAIAYGLGLESILGPGRRRPFPKSLYDVIYDNKKDENPYDVISSKVVIGITNNSGITAYLSRDVKGDSDKVIVESAFSSGEYFLGTTGVAGVGASMSEKGFHFWLAKFIGWELPTVTSFDGKDVKLYLECIFPLFFIEQKRGWSEIQANTPSNYGIKNVKRSALEFCLAVDDFTYDRKVAVLKNKIQQAELEWISFKNNIEGVADYNSVRVDPPKNIEEFSAEDRVRFFYPENNALISVHQQLVSVQKLIRDLSGNVAGLHPVSDKLNEQVAVIGSLQRKYEEIYEKIETNYISNSDVEKKLATLSGDLNQYQQLRKLRNVGGSIDSDLGLEKCPICESELYDTLGKSSLKRMPMTLDENIVFLRNQVDFFSAMKDQINIEISRLKGEADILIKRLKTENEKLQFLRNDYESVNGDLLSILREKISAELLLKQVSKLKETEDEINAQAERILSAWSNAKNSLALVESDVNQVYKNFIIAQLERLIRENLLAFKFKESAIDSVSISHQTLRPEQEGYDIVAETSASDYIRIIWSFTLGLLQLAGGDRQGDDESLKKFIGIQCKHSGFVVFDEPRQHEASKLSFTNLIKKASESISYGGQVIFATSLDNQELIEACNGVQVNLKSFDDYVLQLRTK